MSLLRVSVRLNVVLSQSAGNPPRQRDFESEMVARLIAAAGIDLSLIGSIASLDAAATDRLMLEGLRGDLALLSWFSSDEAAEYLAAAGIVGRRAPHRLDPEPVSAGPHSAGAPSEELAPQAELSSPSPFRRIYYFDLHRHRSAASLQSAIEQLLAARRVVTFNLGIPGKPTPTRAAGGESSPDGAGSPGDSASPDGIAPPGERAAARETDPWDALVDELNDSDI